MKVCYIKESSNINYEDFYLENIGLFNDDIKSKTNEILCLFQSEIGKLYICDKIKLVNKLIDTTNELTIYYPNNFYKLFFEELFNKLNEID